MEGALDHYGHALKQELEITHDAASKTLASLEDLLNEISSLPDVVVCKAPHELLVLLLCAFVLMPSFLAQRFAALCQQRSLSRANRLRHSAEALLSQRVQLSMSMLCLWVKCPYLDITAPTRWVPVGECSYCFHCLHGSR